MTKLKLKFTKNDEVLSKDEMKLVYGGYMSGSGDTGSNCYWYRCMCSEPESVIIGSTSSQFIKVLGEEDAGAKALKECAGYRRADCTKDQPC